MDGDHACYELKTVLKLKSLHCLNHLILQRLVKAGLKSSSRVSATDIRVKNTRKSTKSLFGTELENERQVKERLSVEGHNTYLPKFFVMAVSFLEDHATCEGIFRKAGSITRQKALRAAVNAGEPLKESTSPHDVAALLKQYLRELPEPLLTCRLYPVFVEIIRSSHLSKDEKEFLVLLTCLLLPEQHLVCLKVLMSLLHRVAKSAHSLMDSESLALVISPNIINSSKGEALFCDMKNTFNVTQILIEKAAEIFKLPVDLLTPCGISGQVSSPYVTRKSLHARRESVSGKLWGTWTKIRGKRSAQLKDDEEEPSACKKLALEEESDDLLVGVSTVSVGTSKRNGRRLRNSILHRKRKRKTVLNHFDTPCTVPSKTSKPISVELDLPMTVDRPSNIHCNTLSNNTDTETPSGKERREAESSFTIVSKVLQMEEFQQLVPTDADATIGERVRKRKQHERTLTQPSSTDCISQSELRSKLPVSQSDSSIWQTYTLNASVNSRPKLRATSILRSKSTVEKRKGVVFEPGFDIRTLALSSRRQKRYGVCEEDESLCLLSSNEDDILKVEETITKERRNCSIKDVSGASTFSEGRRNVSGVNIGLFIDKTPPVLKSPGLLKKVTSEINERFRHTPKQLAPIVNNDSYLFAVEDMSEHEHKICKSPLLKKKSSNSKKNNTSNVLADVQNIKDDSLPVPRPSTPLPVGTYTRLRSVTKPLSSPFLSTPSWKPKRSSPWSGKLTR